MDSFTHGVKHGVDLAEFAAKEIKRYKHWTIVIPPQLAIINFQFQPPNLGIEQTNLLNKAIIDGIVESGFAMISSTKLKGKLVIRLCIINPRTTEEDIKETIRRLNMIGQKELSDFLHFA